MTEVLMIAGFFLFILGLIAVLTRRNAVMALIGIELILNAAGLNFVAFSKFYPMHINGQMAVIFIIAVAAAEVAVGLAILIRVYRKYQTLNLDEINTLREK